MPAPGAETAREPMFEREYYVEGFHEKAKKVVLHIFEPQPDEEGWVCEYRLRVPTWEQEICVPVHGADKLGSVTSAIRRIVADLRLISERLGRRVTRFRSSDVDLI